MNVMSKRFARAQAQFAMATFAVLLSCPLWSQAQVSDEFCGPVPMPMQSGPWDYRTERYYLPIVENAHFTPSVELLLRGKTDVRLGPDLEYTLVHIPNHHRALVAISKLADRSIDDPKIALPRPVECYFNRAVRFRPGDTVVRILYGRFLAGRNRRDEAVQQLQYAARLTPEAPITQRNVGLVFVEMKAWDLALRQAHVLLKLDPAETSLKSALERAGQWKEPPPPAAPADAASAPGAASAPEAQH